MAVSSDFDTGRKTVGTSAVRLLPDSAPTTGQGVQIHADVDNAGVIYVGSRSNITADSDDDTDGFPIKADQDILIKIRNLAQVYVIASQASQKLWWIAV